MWDPELAYCFSENALECTWVALLCEAWAELLRVREETDCRHHVGILCGSVYRGISEKVLRKRQDDQWLSDTQRRSVPHPGTLQQPQATSHLCRIPERPLWCQASIWPSLLIVRSDYRKIIEKWRLFFATWKFTSFVFLCKGLKMCIFWKVPDMEINTQLAGITKLKLWPEKRKTNQPSCRPTMRDLAIRLFINLTCQETVTY